MSRTMTYRLFRPRPIVALGLFVLAGSGILIQWLRFRSPSEGEKAPKSSEDELPQSLRQNIGSDGGKRTENDELQEKKTTTENRVLHTAGQNSLVNQNGKTPDMDVVIDSKPAESEKSQNADLESEERESLETRDRSAVLNGYMSVLDDKPLTLNCKSCALVSSSGRVLGQKKGSEIDEADCVFRMNAAPAKGFEIDVGHKTTIRVLSQFSVAAGITQIIRGQESLSFFISWGADKHLGKTTPKYREMVSTANKYPQIGFYRSSDEHYWYQDEIFEKETGQKRMSSGSWLTTGWFTFDVMKQACPTTKIYGMVPEDFCK